MTVTTVTSWRIPTMKPLDLPKKEEKAAAAPAEAPTPASAEPEKIDFSNVVIEPLFQDQVDFETFSKSDFRAVKVLECEAVKKSKKLLQFALDDGSGTPRTILSAIHREGEEEKLHLLMVDPHIPAGAKLY